MCINDKTQVAHEVLAYLVEHRDAQDTLDGIVEWWLLKQRIEQQKAIVLDALTDLVREKLVCASQGKDAQVRYRLNRRKAKHIAKLINKPQ